MGNQRSMSMANLQVKSIDDDLYESLGRRAAMENRSISQEIDYDVIVKRREK